MATNNYEGPINSREKLLDFAIRLDEHRWFYYLQTDKTEISNGAALELSLQECIDREQNPELRDVMQAMYDVVKKEHTV